MSTISLNYCGVALFLCAVIHTFGAPFIKKYSHRKEGAWKAFLHLAGEVELTFALWALLGCVFFLLLSKGDFLLAHFHQLDFHEPFFVFLILVFTSTRPILRTVERLIQFISRGIPLSEPQRMLAALLTVGPLCGSLITEPAAMALVAFLLKDRYFATSVSLKFRYSCLAVLFVNISVGGVLTAFAAPPVVMVAKIWNWDTPFMFSHFAVASVSSILINTGALCLIFKKEISKTSPKILPPLLKTDFILAIFNLGFVILLVTNHSFLFQTMLFFLFLIFYFVTRKFQSPLKFKEALLVGLFLGGLVFFGDFQKIWLEPTLSKLGSFSIFSLTTLLTGFIDNAAITFLCSKIPNFSESLRIFLMKGAVAGGGLTLIANAPNPAGFTILESAFKKEGFNAIRFFLVALAPTLVVCLCFWFL